MTLKLDLPPKAMNVKAVIRAVEQVSHVQNVKPYDSDFNEMDAAFSWSGDHLPAPLYGIIGLIGSFTRNRDTKALLQASWNRLFSTIIGDISCVTSMI